MSRFAYICLVLTMISACGTFLFPQSLGVLAPAWKAGLGIFGLLFLVAMVIGRRIKFDPVLR
ncbi:hypothetical protein GFL09_04130 [Pseudomonas stutzeri]|uniref:Uncharacterized protein n=1 Tax=Stutzerimonas stutzeri KOS6 TaxID=1218352 RepID=A0A061JNL3_STUST|nr:PA3371 family protein [Stutzerimonas stutzeri]EWC39784.1 hypothetical protein B597_018210 [Stutzerimonas stutzeri KOS6]MBK3866882.1 hypothetical protein [Stutzerimonas stutzeri]